MDRRMGGNEEKSDFVINDVIECRRFTDTATNRSILQTKLKLLAQTNSLSVVEYCTHSHIQTRSPSMLWSAQPHVICSAQKSATTLQFDSR